ncbi:dUTP diphosphatase [Candidatus Dojkabacteria bacterium]|jgi:dUTP pyrophosphatase|nr:dUTP diphosphatase [Candidatus Dojkabacteria bacterium]
MQIKIKKLTETAITPTYATDGSGCFDLYYSGKSQRLVGAIPISLETGIAFEIPENYVMLVFSRSGHGFKNAIRLANCVGVIDSDYRGEVIVKLHPDVVSVDNCLTIYPGDRIAQAIIIPYPRVEFLVTDELSSTERGTGGFGSTDNKSIV